GRQDAVARSEGQRVEAHIPCARGVFDDRDLVPGTSQQRRRGVVDVLDGLYLTIRSLVATNARLQPEMREHGIKHGLGHQTGAGIVEMQHGLAAWRFPPGAHHVECHSLLHTVTFLPAYPIFPETTDRARKKRTAIVRWSVQRPDCSEPA